MCVCVCACVCVQMDEVLISVCGFFLLLVKLLKEVLNMKLSIMVIILLFFFHLSMDFF